MKAGYKTAPNYGQKPKSSAATNLQQQPQQQQQPVQRPGSAPRYSVPQQQQQPRPYFPPQQNVTAKPAIAVPFTAGAVVSPNRVSVPVNATNNAHAKPVVFAQPQSVQGYAIPRASTSNSVQKQNPTVTALNQIANPLVAAVPVPSVKASPAPAPVPVPVHVSDAAPESKKSKKDAAVKKESTNLFQNLTNLIRGSGDEKKAAEQELNEIKNAVQNDLTDSNGAFATLKQAIERLRQLLRLKSNTSIPSLIPFREEAQPNTTLVSVDRNDEKVYERIVLNVAGRVADPVTVSDIRNLVKGILAASTEFSSINYSVQLNPIVVQTRELGQKRKWAKSTIDLVITQVWEAFIFEAYLSKGGVPAFYSFLKTHLIQTDYFWVLRKDGVSAKLGSWADYQTELLKSRKAAIEAAVAAAAAAEEQQQTTTTPSESL